MVFTWCDCGYGDMLCHPVPDREETQKGKQMKLIDADEFAIEEPKLWDWSSVDGISSTAVLKQCIWDVQCAPTVNAIPVEWVKKWCNEEHNRKSLEERLLKRYGVITMLNDWEKENEANAER